MIQDNIINNTSTDLITYSIAEAAVKMGVTKDAVYGDLVMDSVRKYGERADENAPSVTLDMTLAAALAQYMQLQEQKSRCDAESRKIESNMKRLRGQIVSVMGSSCKAVCQRDGQDYTVTYNPVRRLDVSRDNLLRLQLNHPEIYDEYVTVSEHRRFYVKAKEATAA